MKNIEQCLRVINYGKTFRETFEAINVVFVSHVVVEPKPVRSSSTSQESSTSNSYATDDRDRQSIVLNPLPGVGAVTGDFSGSNDCVLHVICSPMVI